MASSSRRKDFPQNKITYMYLLMSDYLSRRLIQIHRQREAQAESTSGVSVAIETSWSPQQLFKPSNLRPYLIRSFKLLAMVIYLNLGESKWIWKAGLVIITQTARKWKIKFFLKVTKPLLSHTNFLYLIPYTTTKYPYPIFSSTLIQDVFPNLLNVSL